MGSARAKVAVAAVALAAVSCGPPPATGDGEVVGSSPSGPAAAGDAAGAESPGGPATPARRVVEVPAGGASAGPEPAARTEQGGLRARHVPVWSDELEAAFPPEVCHSAWELDAIAEPDPGADAALLGDFGTAAALAVMRYEYLLSRALHRPDALAQLCVAVASVEPARSRDLAVLASYLSTGSRRAEPAAYPDDVVVVAAGPANVLAVACVAPGYPTVMGSGGQVASAPRAQARLQAYLLEVSRGIEDGIVDVSYRVSDGTHRPGDDCTGLGAWAAEWDGQVQAWLTEGQIWQTLGTTLNADRICGSPPPEGPDECPRDWPL